jgi:uncharacterized protein YndB with AHSA1/START domain
VPDKVQVTREGETRAMFRVHINGTIDAVWNEITKTDAVIPAFFNTRMHCHSLTPGSKLAMRTADGKYTGVVGKILEINPPHRLVHTFKFTNYDDPACVVAYDLEQVDGGVAFTLTISDLPVGTRTAKQMLQGGVMISNTLKAVIETGRPALGTRLLFVVFKLMAPLSPKKCRSEHWPVD